MSRYRSILNRMSQDELRALLDRLLAIVPALGRDSRRIDEETLPRFLLGTTTAQEHMSWVRRMIRRLEEAGLRDRGVLDELYDIMAAIEFLGRRRTGDPEDLRIPLMSDSQARDMLCALDRPASGDLENLLRITSALRGTPQTSNTVRGFLAWLLHKKFAVPASHRLRLGALVEHIDGFGNLARPQAIANFRENYQLARRRKSDFDRGKGFEKFANRYGLKLVLNLNRINSVGKKTQAQGWKYNGRKYYNGKKDDASSNANFVLFDAIVKDLQSHPRVASIADGGFSYLQGKFLRLLPERDSKQFQHFERATEELMFHVGQGRTSLLPWLVNLTQPNQLNAAMSEVMRQAMLLVHPTSVVPLRALIASRDDFPDLLNRYRSISGQPNATARDLLALIQAGF